MNFRLQYHLILLAGLVLFSACSGEEEKEVLPDYSFVVAGHVYGHPDRFTSSVYPPFIKSLDSLLGNKRPDHIILTGDVVAHPTEENWETVRKEMDERGIPWVIAPGNHDISVYMDQHIQDFKYKAIREQGNLLLVLNTTHPGWAPDSLQQLFIRDELNDLDSIQRIFVFSHQLWWLNQPPAEMDIDSTRPNSYYAIEGPHTFWETSFQHFSATDKPVYFVAGDMGCHEIIPSYYEDQYQNFHFYGSGMGGGVEDNYLFIQIYGDSVAVERVDFR